jgi:hypothetical protein
MPRTSQVVSALKLFEADQELAVEILNQAQPHIRSLTLQEIIREAVHSGLPTVSKRYKALAEAARKVDKES